MAIEKKEPRLSQIIIDFDMEQIKIVVVTEFEDVSDDARVIIATERKSVISKQTSREAEFVNDLDRFFPAESISDFLTRAKAAYTIFSDRKKVGIEQFNSIEEEKIVEPIVEPIVKP